MLAEVCLGVAVAGLVAYAVFGGADFGGGIWDLLAGGPEKGARARGLIRRSITPVWETNHVWLPFVLVVLWTGFPLFFGSIMSTLYVPLFLATGGIISRGTAFAIGGQATRLREARVIGVAFALSSVLVPFCFGAAIGGVASGRVPVGNAAGDAFSSWLNPTSAVIGVLAVLSSAYLAAVFLAGDAVRAGLPDLEEGFRRRALASGAVAGALAVGALPVLHSDARYLYDGLTSSGGLVLLLVSVVGGAATLGLVATRRYEVARVSAGVAVAAIVAGWAVAQRPYLLPGKLTIDQAAANHATLTALLISLAGGALLLVPSLVLLYRLVLRGRLDEEFHPLDEQWRQP
ncbi:MAG: cytochrome bd ubiquinol oxidase subunit [Thermoleophilaceae bacterium]|jgi:cytochrome d ubiquinol oxidase subunit II|nr:cytochrome bd ubiquinol oxidase subunit [Thermoleophilaceae bacterium]